MQSNDLNEIMNILSSSGAGITEYKSEIDQQLAELDRLMTLYDETALQRNLAKYVEERFREARSARTAEGVDEEMAKSSRAYNNKYNPEDMEMVAQTSDIYAPLTKTKCIGLKDWIVDILSNAADKPWTLEPSPEPELPEWMEEEIVRRLDQEVMSKGVDTFGRSIIEQATAMKDLARKHASDIAKERTKKMEDRIYDQMLKADWINQFGAFVHDLSYMPCGVLHGPVVEKRRVLSYRGGQAKEVEQATYVLRRVDPTDFYPAPGATTTQDAAYVCEVRAYTASQLLAASNLYGVDQSAIRKVIANNPGGYSLYTNTMDTFTISPANNGPAKLYETIVYCGAVDGAILLEHGFQNIDPHDVEEMEVWVCNGVVMRALRNPYPLKTRPYHAATFSRKAGKFWGTSLPMQIHHIQRMVNGAIRALAKDMAFTAGPFVQADVERLVSVSDVSEAINPNKIILIKPDYTSGGADAVRINKLPSSAASFIATYDRFKREADDASNVPDYALGNPNVAGAGRTLGGLSLLMGNASKGVKRVVADIDRYVIEPIVTLFYQINLLYSTDDSIKADAQPVARGASGLLQRELSQSRAAEVLPLLLQGQQMGLVEPSSIATVMRDILVALGYPADLVPDPERQQQIMALAQQQGGGADLSSLTPQQGAPGNTGMSAPVLPPASPPVSLDGRSAPPSNPLEGARL